MFPETPQIEKTINYDLFKKIEWNRSIDKGNLKKLIDENRKDFQLHRFPILVTKDYQIIDGQHRFEVAKEIGSPVYFIRDGYDNSFRAVHSVNKAGKRHTVTDKVEMLYKAGDEGATTIYKVFNLYGGTFDISCIAAVLTRGSDGGDTKKSIDDEGAIKLNNYEHGIEVLDALQYSSIPEKGKGRTVLALAILSRKSGVHPKAIIKRTQANASKWINPKTRQECVRAFQTCYNYNLEVKNRI